MTSWIGFNCLVAAERSRHSNKMSQIIFITTNQLDRAIPAVDLTLNKFIARRYQKNQQLLIENEETNPSWELDYLFYMHVGHFTSLKTALHHLYIKMIMKLKVLAI